MCRVGRWHVVEEALGSRFTSTGSSTVVGSSGTEALSRQVCPALRPVRCPPVRLPPDGSLRIHRRTLCATQSSATPSTPRRFSDAICRHALARLSVNLNGGRKDTGRAQRHPQRSTRWRATRSVAAAKRCTSPTTGANRATTRRQMQEWRRLVERLRRTPRRRWPCHWALRSPTELGVSSRGIRPVDRSPSLSERQLWRRRHARDRGGTVLKLRASLRIEAAPSSRASSVSSLRRTLAQRRYGTTPLRALPLDRPADALSALAPTLSAASTSRRSGPPSRSAQTCRFLYEEPSRGNDPSSSAGCAQRNRQVCAELDNAFKGAIRGTVGVCE